LGIPPRPGSAADVSARSSSAWLFDLEHGKYADMTPEMAVETVPCVRRLLGIEGGALVKAQAALAS
jgi:hypothetical protein